MTRKRITTLLVLADIVAAALAWVTGLGLRFHPGVAPPEFGPYAALLPVVLAAWPVMFALHGLYRPARGRSLVDEGFAVGLAAVVATMVVFGADAYYRLYHEALLPAEARFQFSRNFITAFLALDVLFTVGLRTGVRRWVKRLRRSGRDARRVLVLGAGDLGSVVARTIRENPEHGYQVVGFADDDLDKKGAQLDGVPVLGTTDDVLGLVRQERVSELLIALPWSAHDKVLWLLDEASREGLNVKLVPDLLQHIAIRAGFEDLDGIPLLNLSDHPLSHADRVAKRALDIAGALIGLVFLSPALAVLAVLVKRSSLGPVIYRQERMGLDGERFTMYKFRTMPVDAEVRSGPVWADDRDPRATAVGQTLRHYSLDELPQLWNVLRGDMSLVGPRPERPSFVAKFKDEIPDYMLRHRMKTGMTGWAQVNGWRGNTSIRKRIEHDVYYLRNWSLRLDLEILCRTVLHAVRRR